MESAITAPITIRGRYFFCGSERFFIRGICYQTLPPPRTRTGSKNAHQLHDPISDDHLDQLQQDIPLFKELNLNTILVFSVDNTRSHGLCMRALADVGIYVLLCLSTPTMSISRVPPHYAYTSELLDHHFNTIDCFDKYPNVLGVFAGNEVVNGAGVSKAAEAVRAVVRDTKRYMRVKRDIVGSRALPVGYSAAYDNFIMKASAEYFTAEPEEDSVDFYAIKMNDYSWCGPSSLINSGRDGRIKLLSDIHVPLFWSEYGTYAQRPRPFDEVLALYSPAVTEVLSGGCVYELHAGVNNYGLVETYPDRSVGRRKDFHNLKDKMAKVVESMAENIPVKTDPEGEGPKGTKRLFPRVNESDRPCWQATSQIPPSPIDWSALAERLRDQDWVQVEPADVYRPAMGDDRLAIRTKIQGTDGSDAASPPPCASTLTTRRPKEQTITAILR